MKILESVKGEAMGLDVVIEVKLVFGLHLFVEVWGYFGRKSGKITASFCGSLGCYLENNCGIFCLK